jgi:hypothetical protein
MTLATWMFLGNVVSTFCLVGLIWTVQLVHYPAFAYVDGARFQAFEAFHQQRITWIVLPLMLLEIATAFALLWWRPAGLPLATAIAGMALLVIIWLSTFALQVPLHTQLAQGAHAGAIERLVLTNWIRTGAWTGRGILLAWSLMNMLAAERGSL